MIYMYIFIRSFPHRSHDLYVRHRTQNILDLAVVQRNFIFTVAVDEAEKKKFGSHSIEVRCQFFAICIVLYRNNGNFKRGQNKCSRSFRFYFCRENSDDEDIIEEEEEFESSSESDFEDELDDVNGKSETSGPLLSPRARGRVRASGGHKRFIRTRGGSISAKRKKTQDETAK